MLRVLAIWMAIDMSAAMRNAKTLIATAAAALTMTANPVLAQTADEPPKPSSRAAQEAECAASSNKPSWCFDRDVREPNGGITARGSWSVILASDEMDVDKEAEIETKLYLDGRAVGWLTISVWNGGSFIQHKSSVGGRYYWPWCANNLDRISVDGAPVQYLATVERGGECDRIAANGRAMSAMKRGNRAKIRFGGNDNVYEFNLTGFTAAFNRAVQITRR